MRCTGLSVIKGTEISSFNVEILDVIAAETGLSGAAASWCGSPARRSTPPASAPASRAPRSTATAATPARSPRASATTATRSRWPRRSRRSSATGRRAAGRRAPGAGAAARRARRSAGPLTRQRPHRPHAPRCSRGRRAAPSAAAVRGARRARSAATRRRRSCPAPRWPRRSRPATSRSARWAPSPTATATTLWAFGHPLDGLGRRALFLQDAYVFGVIQNPLGIQDLGAITYKLASAGGQRARAR